METTYDKLVEKWAPVLNEESAGSIKDHHRRSVTAAILENQERALSEERAQHQGFMTEAAPGNNTGSVGTWDPVLISLVRRSMPNMIAYDLCGVQPMTGPTGLIFAMKSKYGTQGGDEAFFNEADTDFSGVGSGHLGGSSSLVGDINPPGQSGQTSADANSDGVEDVFGAGQPAATATAEALGDGAVSGMGTGGHFNEMAFSIEKATVTAKSRALKAEYSMELAQDLKAIHGLDAETELANILSAEILNEINREVIRSIYVTAKPGAQTDTATAGTFDMDVDSNGRWSVEKFKGLMFQLERDANVIAQETRRGKGNVIICSSDVASALQMAGVLDYTPALNNNLQVDDTGNTFAGVMNGRIKVYIDPYFSDATNNYYTLGYKGSSSFDAGLFYCPYVPLQMVRAVGENTFQPKIGFKTRYGMVANPFATNDGNGTAARLGTGDGNIYYRLVKVANLM